MTGDHGSQAGSEKPKREPKPTFAPEYIRDLSEKVYRINLNRDSGGGAPERMIEKDGDNGEKLRNRAGAYDNLTRTYLKVLGFEPSPLPSTQRPCDLHESVYGLDCTQCGAHWVSSEHFECALPTTVREAPKIQSSDGGVESRNARSVSLADGSQSSGSTLGLAEIAGVAPSPSETTPSGHHKDCDWHADQYPWECTCGALAVPPAVRGGARE